MRRVVIVGASAAGLRCAARLKRLQPGWRVTVVEEREAFSDAACGLPYVLSGDIDEVDELRRTSWGALRDRELFEAAKGLVILDGWRATAIDAGARRLTVRSGRLSRTLPWDELVLATGARPRRLPRQPRHELVRCFHTRDDLIPLKRALIQGRIEHVAIIGAGLVGCELAEAFSSLWGARVTLIEAAEAPLPMIVDSEIGAIVGAHLKAKGIELLCGSPVRSLRIVDGQVRINVGRSTVQADAAVVAAGVEPSVELAASAGVAIGVTGAIAVGSNLATSVEHIWAAGDCIEVRHAITGEAVHLPLGSLANRQGRTLANILAGLPDRFGPVAGATAVKVFDLHVAAAGCSAAQARRHGLQAHTVWLTAEDRAHYWPEAEELYLELVADPRNRVVLGVAAAGLGEAVKRIDVATQYILQRATIDQLAGLEHAYAPPFAPALDPLAVAAFLAQSSLDGRQAESPTAPLDGRTVLDVRLPEERRAQPVGDAEIFEIPYEELRGRIRELDAGRPWLLVCERGARSAEALLWLRENGLDASYLGGGMLWREAAGIGGSP